MAISVKLGCVANLYSRMMHFEKAGDTEHTHTHSFDHLTLLAAGSVKCIANDKETIFKAPHMIYINKDTNHAFTALEDNTVAYCIHAMRIGEKIEDIVDPTMIPNGASVPFGLSHWWSPPENYNGENKEVVKHPPTSHTGKIPKIEVSRVTN
jgi:hypothetical protein